MRTWRSTLDVLLIEIGTWLNWHHVEDYSLGSLFRLDAALVSYSNLYDQPFYTVSAVMSSRHNLPLFLGLLWGKLDYCHQGSVSGPRNCSESRGLQRRNQGCHLVLISHELSNNMHFGPILLLAYLKWTSNRSYTYKLCWVTSMKSKWKMLVGTVLKNLVGHLWTNFSYCVPKYFIDETFRKIYVYYSGQMKWRSQLDLVLKTIPAPQQCQQRSPPSPQYNSNNTVGTH
jgi:hypothetical protein